MLKRKEVTMNLADEFGSGYYFRKGVSKKSTSMFNKIIGVTLRCISFFIWKHINKWKTLPSFN